MTRPDTRGSDLRTRLQQTLTGSFTIDSELGGGGMSRVFVAEETRLGRKVVVKVLSPELAEGISVERFEREIRLAASLQHAHIVPVLSTGEVDGLPWFTMPFIEGESLRTRVARGALPIGECISILRDVARALTYAHGRDVVHRDIKPDNVMFSAGSAVVTDFGIAKALSASRTGTGSETLTQLGTSIGTPAYMAPEQAAGDPNVDARADIYAFGCTAYELLTGSSPFAGRTPQRMLAAHMAEVPRDVRELRPDTPSALADLVMRSLAKDANDRPQSAAEIARALDTITSGSMTAQPAILLGGPAMFRRALLIYVAAFVAVMILAKAAIVGIGLPDWVFPGALIVMALGLPVILFTAYAQRINRQIATATPTLTPGGTASVAGPQGTVATLAMKATPYLGWRRTLRAGIAALLIFMLVVAGFMVMRARGIGPFGSLMGAGTVANQARVLVTDFTITGADSGVRHTIVDMTRTSLAQSSVIRVAPEAYAPAALKRMKLADTLHITRDLARQLAQRDGIALIVDGSITSAAGGYIVVMKLVQASTNADLYAARETGNGVNGLVAAVDKLTHRIRDRLGESLRNLQQVRPLSAVTTNSIDALRKYSEGNDIAETLNFSAAVPLLRDAVAIDPDFAEAWRKLAVELLNTQAPSSAVDSALSRAYQLREKLPSRERSVLEATFFAQNSRGDRARAIAIYDGLASQGDLGILNNLSSLYRSRRDLRRADSLLRARMTPTATLLLRTNLAQALIAEGNLIAADSVMRDVRRRGPLRVSLARAQLQLLLQHHDFDALAAFVDSMRRQTADSALHHEGIVQSGRVALLHGQFSRFRQFEAELGDTTLPDRAAVMAFADAFTPGGSGIAVQRLDAALAAHPLRAMAPADRPDFDVARAYAMNGRPDKARAVLAAYQSVLDTALLRNLQPYVHTILGVIARAEGRTADALRELRLGDRATDGPVDACALCLPLELARTFDAAQMSDSAVAMYEEYLRTPQGSSQMWLPASPLLMAPSVHLRLAQLYDEKGDRVSAAKHYQAFIDLYRNADAALQPQVADARIRLARLGDTPTTTSLPTKH